MMNKRRLVTWAFASAGILAFVLGASAQEVVRAISQAVVTPENPIWAQDPAPQEGEAPQENAPAAGRGNQGARGAPSLQPGHHGGRQDR